MRYVVTPGEGVGAIRFGMSREEVHTRLGPPDDDGGWPDTGETEDEWTEDGLAIVFDAADACVEIALFPPASVSVRGTRLLGEADDDARAALASLDPACGEQDGVLVSPALGLLYSEDEDGDPELVVVAEGRLDALAASEDDDDDADAAESP